MKAASGWSAARRATLARDEHRCQKCFATSGLEVHHKLERVHGGGDDLDNLITLCSHCHDEWTYAAPPSQVMTFEQWLAVPAARFLVPLFAKPWPSDVTAAEFKAAFLELLARAGRGR